MAARKAKRRAGQRGESTARAKDLYTYRGGVRVPLKKRVDQFVARVSPERAAAAGFAKAERVSPHSTRVTTTAAELDAAMLRARELAPVHHAYDEAATGQEFLITDRVIVTFKRAPSAAELSEFLARYALIQLNAYSDREFLLQLTNHTGMNPVKVVVRISEGEPLVDTIDHDLNMRATTAQLALPSDPAYQRQWHLHTHSGLANVDRRSCANCEGAWQLLDHFGDAQVVVGVTDDGCRLDHGDFNSQAKFAAWGYFEGSTLVTNGSPSADAQRMYSPGDNHGTNCAGVVAAEVDAALTVGAAPGCRLLPIKWELDVNGFLQISDSKLRAAIDFMADKVDVISNSWGSSPRATYSSLVLSRVRQLAVTGGRRGRGIVFLWAAGNDNCPIQHSGSLDIPYTNGWNATATQWVGVRTARAFEHNLTTVPGVVHVAALASTAQRSHYSNYGTGIGICAPSNNSHKYRRASVQGRGITTAQGTSPTSTTDLFGGTSSATPLVAGIAALVISANPQLTALEVVSVLQRTASKDLDATAYARTPAASFDQNPTWDISPAAPFASGAFQNTGHPDGTWSPWFGHGRVDAIAAVAEAIRMRPPAQQGLARASAPGRAIPDNAPAGVSDSITFSEAGRVSALSVSVDISHSYVGDLTISLRAPSGRSVNLQSRSGGNAANLRKTFSLANTPALGGVTGESLAGAWTLQVVDAAPVDTGVLNRWEIDAALAELPAVELEDAPGLSIPDNDARGIERSLTVNGAGAIGDVRVSLDITHSYIGDLEITLVPPSSAPIVLHQRAGGDADNILGVYDATRTPALAALRGQAMSGAWRLKVADRARVDTGKLNRWSLRIDR